MWSKPFKAAVSLLIIVACLVLGFQSAESASNYQTTRTMQFYGAGTNTTFSTEFTIDINLTINADDSVTGTLDATGLPNGRTICGAGELTGTKTGNQIEFTFTSFDNDPGCGFDHGLVNTSTAVLSPDERVLSGSYTIDNGQQGVFRAFSENSWPNLDILENINRNYTGTNREPYAKQYLCIATRSCDNFEAQGSNSWANGFVRHLFEDTMGDSGIPLSVLTRCYDSLPNWLCFSWQGEFHYEVELVPGFISYCLKYYGEINYEQWDSDHTNFLNNAIKPCLDNLADEGLLSSVYVEAAKLGIITRVTLLRETVQAICAALELFGNQGVSSASVPVLPPAPSQDDLFSEELANQGALSVTADKFFVPVGEQIQLNVQTRNRAEAANHHHMNIEYVLNVDESIATVTSDGLISIHASPNPITATPTVLLVAVRSENDFGVGQFSITDVDSDGDLMVDSYETRAGLNPDVANSLSSDRDGDLLPDIVESLTGTNPRNRDSDNDGISDSFEIYTGSDPLNAECDPFNGCTYGLSNVYLPVINR